MGLVFIAVIILPFLARDFGVIQMVIDICYGAFSFRE